MMDVPTLRAQRLIVLIWQPAHRARRPVGSDVHPIPAIHVVCRLPLRGCSRSMTGGAPYPRLDTAAKGPLLAAVKDDLFIADPR